MKSSKPEPNDIRQPFGIDGKSDEEITVNDCIEVRYDSVQKKLKARFAEHINCNGCGGPKKIFYRGREISRPDLAFQVALVEYGYRTLAIYSNTAPSHACDCAEKLVTLGSFFFERAVDVGSWQVSSRGNCYTDYKRVVRFSSDLTENELATVCDFLQRDKCPGWTGVGWRKDPSKESTYVFTTTYDSSG